MKLKSRLGSAVAALSGVALMTSNVHAVKISEMFNSSGTVASTAINIISLLLYGVAIYCLFMFVKTLMGLADERNQKATPKAAFVYFIAGVLGFYIPSVLEGAGEDLGTQQKIGDKLSTNQSGALNKW